MEVVRIQAGPMRNNCWLLSDGRGGCLLIDPGVDGPAILKALREGGLRVEAILITHGHGDHTGQAAWLLEQLAERPPVMMHRADWDGRLPVARFIEDGEVVEAAGVALEAILVPGHTKGSLCYYDRAGGRLFSGDTLFYHSIGSEAYYDGDPMDLTRNIKARLLALPDETVVHPGHMDDTTIGEEAAMNRYLTDKDTPDPWEE